PSLGFRALPSRSRRAWVYFPATPPRPTGGLSMSSPTPSHITSVLKESRTFPPPPAFAAAAHVKSMAEQERLCQRAADDPEGLWAEQAESLLWARRWDRVLEWNEPHAKWFVGGKLNVSANCIDRHL